jgi:hypothetical protein
MTTIVKKSNECPAMAPLHTRTLHMPQAVLSSICLSLFNLQAQTGENRCTTYTLKNHILLITPKRASWIQRIVNPMWRLAAG